MTAFDAKRARADFPIFNRRVRGKPLVYLDSAATSQKPTTVIKALTAFYERHNANIHRGVHTLAEEAERLVEESRAKAARFINAPSPESLVFVRNTTEAVNLVAHGWARKHLAPGDEVLVTELEHHSNLVPWQLLARDKGVRLRQVPVDDEGRVTVEAARRAITPKTRLFAFTAMSNALGTLLPVADLVKVARENGALALVDGAQWVPHRRADVRAWDCDFLAFSGHKMLGPTGAGVLYGKPEVLESMDPFMGGGGMISEVWFERSTWNAVPQRFEAGTPDVADCAAFGAAIDYLEACGFDALAAHEEALTARLLEVLGAQSGVTVYGPRALSERGGVVSFNIEGVHPHDVGQIFDSEGVAVRVGHHCCQPLMRRLHTGGTARASVYLYNTEEDVEAFARALRKACGFFKVGAKA
ncbi:MAG: cysteine desulfurase [Elusimicrobia bacterium]|nr:cysteine desulfurase [Elusimicrobiota bacterium]